MAGKVPSIQNKMADVFSGFRTNHSPSFVFMQTFSPFLLLTDKMRRAVKVINLLLKNFFSTVYIFPCTLNGDIS